MKLQVNLFFTNKGSLMVKGVKYTTYSGEWYSVITLDGVTHRWPSHSIESISEYRS